MENEEGSREQEATRRGFIIKCAEGISKDKYKEDGNLFQKKALNAKKSEQNKRENLNTR